MLASSTRSAFCGKAATNYKVVNLHMNTNVMNQNVALMTTVGMFDHYDHNSEKKYSQEIGNIKAGVSYRCCNSTRHVKRVKHVCLLPNQHLQIPKGRCWHTFHAKRDCTKKIVDRSGTGLNSLATILADRAKRVSWRRHRIAMNVSPSMPAFNQCVELF